MEANGAINYEKIKDGGESSMKCALREIKVGRLQRDAMRSRLTWAQLRFAFRININISCNAARKVMPLNKIFAAYIPLFRSRIKCSSNRFIPADVKKDFPNEERARRDAT